MLINLKHRLQNFNRPLVMGILNLTPDSFYAGSRVDLNNLLQKAQKMLAEGADILDVGAYSSRPGAEQISEAQEWERLQPALDVLAENLPEAIISVDTFRAEIARKAVENYGVAMINDISAGDDDPEMFRAVAGLQVPYVAMHKQGKPETMQNNPQYVDILKDILKYFAKKVEKAHLAGINDFIIDPGFGFGKTMEHNFELLKNLEKFKIIEKPILVGLSRKSMIYKTLKIQPDEALNGTTALNFAALERGADILRVHDVREAVQCVHLFQSLNSKNNNL